MLVLVLLLLLLVLLLLLLLLLLLPNYFFLPQLATLQVHLSCAANPC